LLKLIQALDRMDVLVLGELEREIVRIWSSESEDNLTVVLTGRQRGHYTERHPDTRDLESLLWEALLNPDEVRRNLQDDSMAISYKSVDERKVLRVAILMQSSAGPLKHSILSYRVAMKREMERYPERRVWKRE
jgi:hypothetical protein